jgi:hypothetical protein
VIEATRAVVPGCPLESRCTSVACNFDEQLTACMMGTLAARTVDPGDGRDACITSPGPSINRAWVLERNFRVGFWWWI